jgi:DNA polymerase-1
MIRYATAILDGDIPLYQAASASEIEIRWEDDIHTLHADLGKAKEILVDSLDRLMDMRNDVGDPLFGRLIIALSCSGYRWRPSVLPTYKSNRSGVRKPTGYAALKEWLKENYATVEKPGMEGDDVVGILATMPHGDTRVMVSEDKDLSSVPGWLLNPAKEDAPHFIPVEEADRFHMVQTLAGDPTDGYSGCPGYGMITAERLLDAGRTVEQFTHTLTRGPRAGVEEIRTRPGAEGTPWEIIVSAYEAAGLTVDDALTTARVARICRVADFDPETREVILWNPE